MEHANSFLWEISIGEFLLVTVALGGLGAWLTGRAVANTWGSKLALVRYIVLLNMFVRFIHYSLFEGTLLSPWYFTVDLIVLLIIAFAGMQMTRSAQMAGQYGFEYDRIGKFGWKRRV
ncbi:MAG: DUF6867 family protein [Pseudomonadota bacterium]